MAQLSSRLVISLVDRVTGPAKRVRAALSGMTGAGAMMAAGMGNMRRGAASASAAAVPLAMIGRSGFEAAYGLEKVLNNIQAVGMLTDEQRGSMKAYIQDLNKSFPFINKEIGEAAFELFRAGMSFDQAMGTLKGTLLLAQAGDIERQEAADIATNVLTAMRLPMQTTEQAAASMARVNDVLSYAANKSNTDVRLLGETFKYVAPMAAAAGMSLDDVAAASMTMANNGIKGSEAGVAMRAALVRMAKPTKDMRQTLDRLNIDLSQFITGGRTIGADDIVTGLLSSGVDASGQRKAIEAMLADKVLALKPGQLTANLVDLIAKESEGAADKDVLAETIGDILTSSGQNYDLLGFMGALRDKGVGVAEIARIMDVRQGARVLTLLLDDLKQKSREVEARSEGAAQRMADIRMKGIVGEVARLQAAWENLFVTIGDAGVLRSIGSAFEGMAAGLTRVSQSSPALLEFGTYGLIALATIGPLGLLAGGVASAFTMFGGAAMFAAGAAITLGRALLFAMPAGLLAGGIAGLTGIASAARYAATSFAIFAAAGAVGGRGALIAQTFAGIAAVAGRLAGSLGSLIGLGLRFAGVFGAVAAVGTLIYNNLGNLGSFFSGIADGFMKGLGPAAPMVDSFVDGLGVLFDWLGRLLGPINDSTGAFRSWGETIGAAIAWPIKQIGTLVDLMGQLAGVARNSYVGRKIFGEPGAGVEHRPEDGAEAAAPGSPAAAVVDTRAQTPAASASESAANISSTGAEAQQVVSVVSSAMAQVRSIVAGVNLAAEGQRIIESLAAGMRAGIPAVNAAASQAAAAASRSALRGAYSDGAR